MVPGLGSAVPLAARLPAVLQEDAFLQRLLLAFDDSLAPVFTTLDGLACYLDPKLAPEDFLDWLADWVGVRIHESWPTDQRRAVVANAAEIHRRRGTVPGLADAVRLAVGGVRDVVVEDSGGTSWSQAPGAQLPGQATARLHVRVYADAVGDVSQPRLERIISSVKPAHVPHTVEVISSNGSSDDGT
jgi:phage tail-like protein